MVMHPVMKVTRAALVGMIALAGMPALAQADELGPAVQICRVIINVEKWSTREAYPGNIVVKNAVIELDDYAPDGDQVNGRGVGELTYTPPKGCTLVSAAPRKAEYGVDVKKGSVAGAQIYAGGGGDSEVSKVTLQCGASRVERDYPKADPLTAYMEKVRGGDFKLNDENWDGNSANDRKKVTGTSGVMTVQLCKPGEREAKIKAYQAKLAAAKKAEAEKKATEQAQAQEATNSACAQILSQLDAIKAINPVAYEQAKKNLAGTCSK